MQRDVNFTVEHAFADLQLTDLDQINTLVESVSLEVAGMMAGLDDGPAAAAA